MIFMRWVLSIIMLFVVKFGADLEDHNKATSKIGDHMQQPPRGTRLSSCEEYELHPAQEIDCAM